MHTRFLKVLPMRPVMPNQRVQSGLEATMLLHQGSSLGGCLWLEGKHLFDGEPALLRNLSESAHLRKGLDGCTGIVQWILGTKLLPKHVLHACQLEHYTDCSSRDDTSTLCSWSEHQTSGSFSNVGAMGDAEGFRDGYFHQILLRIQGCLLHSHGDFLGLGTSHSDATISISRDDYGAEPQLISTLDDLDHAADLHDALFQAVIGLSATASSRLNAHRCGACALHASLAWRRRAQLRTSACERGHCGGHLGLARHRCGCRSSGHDGCPHASARAAERRGLHPHQLCPDAVDVRSMDGDAVAASTSPFPVSKSFLYEHRSPFETERGSLSIGRFRRVVPVDRVRSRDRRGTGRIRQFDTDEIRPSGNGYRYGRSNRSTDGRGEPWEWTKRCRSMRRARGLLRGSASTLGVFWEAEGAQAWIEKEGHARGFAKKAYRKLEVILKKDVDQLGFRNEVLKVSPGYARNYLIPKKLVVIATDDRKALLDKEVEAALANKVEERKKQQERIQGLKKVLDKLTSNPIRFDRKSVPGGKLYGSITAADIVKEVREQCKVEITESALAMDTPFKTVGFHSVPLQYKIEGLKDYTLQVLIASVANDESDKSDEAQGSSEESQEGETGEGEGSEEEMKDEEQ